MKKQNLLEAFILGKETGKGSNLDINKGTINEKENTILYNYNKPIAFRFENGDVFLSSDYYSKTTTSNQNLIKKIMNEHNRETKLFFFNETNKTKTLEYYSENN
jgi:hypothetical protein